MILYNGATGGLGRYLAGSLSRGRESYHALAARLEDQAALKAELQVLDPDGAVTLMQLAARVSVPECESDPKGALQTNVVQTRAAVAEVLDWASRRQAITRVLYVSTGHVYATPPEGSKVREDWPTEPRSVYAQTKLAAEYELASVCKGENVPFLAARVFGLLSPHQAPNYVLPALIRRAWDGDVKGIPGLDFARDYLDARDVCDDLLLLSSAPWPNPVLAVNVCSGISVTIRELLNEVLRIANPRRADELARDATAGSGRPDDIRWLVGDPSLFVELTKRLPQQTSISRTVADAVDVKATTYGRELSTNGGGR